MVTVVCGREGPFVLVCLVSWAPLVNYLVLLMRKVTFVVTEHVVNNMAWACVIATLVS